MAASSRRAGRALAAFWIIVLTGTALGAGTLQILGPMAPEAGGAETPREVTVQSYHEAAAQSPIVPEPPRQSTPAASAPLKPGAPVPAPQAAMLETPIGGAPAGLPQVGPDGRKPMHAYAAGVDPYDGRPRIALLFGGIGLSESDSEDALHSLPAAISFVVSSYAAKPDHLLADIRAAGHEFLVALPMEPRNYPLDDPGNQALLTSATPAQNAKRLDWSLSRFAGYAGVTNAAGNLRGERFAAGGQMTAVLQALARRGLFYIDSGTARPADAPPSMVARGIDLVLDEPAVRTEIEAKLATLEAMARERGAVIGFATLPRPVTIDRIAAWTAKLSEHGIALVPVSAVAAMPPFVSHSQ